MRAYYDPVGSQALWQTVNRSFSCLCGSRSPLSGGCVYRANIAQGNLIKQEDLDQAEVGMTRNQIRFLLGTPMIDDPFHKNRWDYVYYLKLGRNDASAKALGIGLLHRRPGQRDS